MSIICKHSKLMNRMFLIDSVGLEFIKLLCLFIFLQIEDKISRNKARVSSTLDRLAQKVAREKQERIDKCRAFKVSFFKRKYAAIMSCLLDTIICFLF